MFLFLELVDNASRSEGFSDACWRPEVNPPLSNNPRRRNIVRVIRKKCFQPNIHHVVLEKVDRVAAVAPGGFMDTSKVHQTHNGLDVRTVVRGLAAQGRKMI